VFGHARPWNLLTRAERFPRDVVSSTQPTCDGARKYRLPQSSVRDKYPTRRCAASERPDGAASVFMADREERSLLGLHADNARLGDILKARDAGAVSSRGRTTCGWEAGIRTRIRLI
jgi:hypothetical protein